jgi:hypothetical protein
MGKSIDLTGQRFGRLTAVKQSGYSPNGKERKWECRCDCGKIVYVTLGSLRSGNSKSCGCLKSESVSKRNLKDLTGKRFGRLTVLEKSGHSGELVTWKCICECGNIAYVTGKNLNIGSTKSCGCLQNEFGFNGKHNLKNHYLYHIWKGIKSRCYNKKIRSYKNYGAKGIDVCEE